MVDHNINLQKKMLNQLRQQAEAALQKSEIPVGNDPPNQESLAQKIHELHVYQVELEMQNEELIAAQHELEASRRRYIELYDYAPVGYLSIDEEGTVIEANITITSMLGIERIKLVGSRLSDFIAPEEQERFYLQRQSLFEGRPCLNFEVGLVRSDGLCFDASLECFASDSSFAPRQARIAIIDISSQRQAERERKAAEESNRLKALFIAMVTHELKTPLTPILGYTSMLRDPNTVSTAEEKQIFAAAILSESQDLAVLIERLLDFSRLQLGELPLQALPHHINAILDAARLEIDALTSQHSLVVEFDDNIPLVMADQQRITQVLVNLIRNAAKHSPEGTTIKLTAIADRADVRIEVSDEGSRIPLAERDLIFDAFHQGKTGLVRGGSGLGLPICKGLVEAHGGRIWVDQSIGQGLTIAFTLPIAS